MTTTNSHDCGFAVPQINTVPSIRYSTINANHKPEAVYQGHLNDGSSVQVHSTDPLYRQHGVHLRCIEGANGRRIWQAIDQLLDRRLQLTNSHNATTKQQLNTVSQSGR